MTTQRTGPPANPHTANAHTVAARLLEHFEGMVLTREAALVVWDAWAAADADSAQVVDTLLGLVADEAAWCADPVVLQRTQREQARLLDVLHGKLKAAKALARQARAQQGLLLDQADDLQQTATHEAFGRAPLDLANPALSTQANNVTDRMPFSERILSTFS